MCVRVSVFVESWRAKIIIKLHSLHSSSSIQEFKDKNHARACAAKKGKVTRGGGVVVEVSGWMMEGKVIIQIKAG